MQVPAAINVSAAAATLRRANICFAAALWQTLPVKSAAQVLILYQAQKCQDLLGDI